MPAVGLPVGRIGSVRIRASGAESFEEFGTVTRPDENPAE